MACRESKYAFPAVTVAMHVKNMHLQVHDAIWLS